MIAHEFRLKLYTRHKESRRLFYEKLLAWPILREWDRSADDWGIMYKLSSDFMIELLPAPVNAQIGNAVDASIAVPDVARLWESLKDKAQIIFPLRDNPWGDSSFCIADPEGFELTFFTKELP